MSNGTDQNQDEEDGDTHGSLGRSIDECELMLGKEASDLVPQLDILSRVQRQLRQTLFERLHANRILSSKIKIR